MLLSKAEELLLQQFHDLHGGRAAAERALLLPSEAVGELAADTPDVDFNGALDSLLARRLLRREGKRYALTEKGYEYLYSRAAERRDEA